MYNLKIHYIIYYYILYRNITVQSGNCCDFDEPDNEISEFRSEKRNLKSVQNETTFEENDSEIQIYLQQLNNIYMGEYVHDILNYISGYIVKNLIKKLNLFFLY